MIAFTHEISALQPGRFLERSRYLFCCHYTLSPHEVQTGGRMTNFQSVMIVQELVSILRSCSKLENLGFPIFTLPSDVLHSIQSKLPAMLHLRLDIQQVTHLHKIHELFPNLSKLSLWNTAWDNINEPETLKLIVQHCKHLTTLHMDFFTINQTIMPSLSRLSNMTDLRLTCAHLNDELCDDISRACPALKLLDLWGNDQISDRGVTYMAMRLFHLTFLDLCGTRISSDIMQVLFNKSKVFPKLLRISVPFHRRSNFAQAVNNSRPFCVIKNCLW